MPSIYVDSDTKLLSAPARKLLTLKADLDSSFDRALGFGPQGHGFKSTQNHGHSGGSLTMPRCKIGTRHWPGQSELTLRIIMCKQRQSTGDDSAWS